MPKQYKDWGKFGYSESDWKSLTNLQRYCKRYPDNECNRGMGLLRDNAELLRKAADYLDKHN